MNVLFPFVMCGRCRCRSWPCASATWLARRACAPATWLWLQASAPATGRGRAAWAPERRRGWLYASRPWLMRTRRRREAALNLLQSAAICCRAVLSASTRGAAAVLLISVVCVTKHCGRASQFLLFSCARRLHTASPNTDWESCKTSLAGCLAACKTLDRTIPAPHSRPWAGSRSIRPPAHRTVGTQQHTPSPHDAS